MIRLAAAVLTLSIVAPASAQSGRLRTLVSVDELPRLLNDPSVVLVHVANDAATYEAAHIPGARFVRYADFTLDGAETVGAELPPVDVVERAFEAAGVSDSSHVILYSQSTVAAARAFFTLDAHGHRQVSLLDGGLGAWRDGNRPIATGPAPAPKAGALTLQLDPQRIVAAAYVRQQAPGKTIALVDVRPDDEFNGRNTMGGAHAAGHIAGAKQLTWNSLVTPQGTFLPAADLKRRLASAGATSGRPVVSYCMVGMRASVVYFVARSLGYDARLYDGSIVDWSRRKLPTVKE